MPIPLQTYTAIEIQARAAAREGRCVPNLQLVSEKHPETGEEQLLGCFEGLALMATMVATHGAAEVFALRQLPDWNARLVRAFSEAGVTSDELECYQAQHIPQYFDAALKLPYQRVHLDWAAYIAASEAVVEECLRRLKRCVALYNRDGVIVHDPATAALPPAPTLVLTLQQRVRETGLMGVERAMAKARAAH